MSSPLGQYGSKGYEGPESRTLGKFAADKFSYREQAKNIIELNNAVGYMSGMMRKMQRGIDEANQNFLQQIQGLINDFLILIGGGGDTGFEWGDFKYVFQAIGALFGFTNDQGEITLPVNLFDAAWHFFSSYIMPVENFRDFLDYIIDSLIAGTLDIFGEVPILGQALQQLAVIISDLRDLLGPIADAIDTFFDIFSLDIFDLPGIKNIFEPLAPIFDSLNAALDGIDLPDFSLILHEIAQWAMPFVQLIPQVINGLEPLINTLIDMGGGILELAVDLLIPIIEIVGPIMELITPVINGIFPIIDAIIALIDVVLSMVGSVGNITNLFDYFLTALSPLNALNLFNVIPQNLIGWIPYSHVGEGEPNLLANPSFDGAVSVQGGSVWVWDAVAGNTSPGSVYTTAQGTLRQLRSNAIPISEGQELSASVFSRWSGMTFTGTPIVLQIVRMMDDDEVGVDDLASPTSPGVNQTSWVEIAGNYTVPAGCDTICLQITINSTVTAGTIRFDDGDIHKVGMMQQSWLAGLLGGATLQDDIQLFLDSLFGVFTQSEAVGQSLDALMQALLTIPNALITGLPGALNIGDTIQRTWDQLVSGFVGIVDGAGGASLLDLLGLGNYVSSGAGLGYYGWDILGVRNNKHLDSGLLATSGSNFGLSRVAMQGSAPTINVTKTVSALGFMRMEQSNDKGVISWLGSGTANITGCYINIWKMDTTTGDLTLVHRSPNIVGNLSATMGWVLYEMPAPLLTQASETYGIEITVTGNGTHQVSGTTTWIPPHPNVFPKTYAATRNSDTAPVPVLNDKILNSNVVYSNNIPWIEWGITIGGAAAPRTPQTNQFVESGNIPIPSWANFIDVIALGAGGGGASGGGYGIPGGYGGAAGNWSTGTWTRATHFPSATGIDIVIGDGGRAGTSAVVALAGTSSVVTIPGYIITATGGAAAASGNQNGQGAGNTTYNTIKYKGGLETAQGYNGDIPGAGGGSGSDLAIGPGGWGARGGVWIVFRET